MNNDDLHTFVWAMALVFVLAYGFFKVFGGAE